ncbi:MAG TPA: hypothetical protein PK090_00275 [Smithellaceae bacterium]|nr:hypothetical protein [Smithellaceae bacterium]
MQIDDLLFPRRLEADGSASRIRQHLKLHPVQMGPDAKTLVPFLTMSDDLRRSLATARLQRRICRGFEAIRDKLQNEQTGLVHLRQKTGAEQSVRLSRLLFFTKDCAPRLSRQIEKLLVIHHPRILACMIDIDAQTLGRLISGSATEIKVILIDHKDAVSDILSRLFPEQNTG